MLSELVNILENNKNSTSIEEVALKLNLETGTVLAMLELLEQLGIVKRLCVQTNCNFKDCSGCIGCNPNNPKLFAWQIVDDDKTKWT